MRLRLNLARIVMLSAVLAGGSLGGVTPAAAAATGRAPTFAAAADAAVETLERRFYHPPGRWNNCVPDRCGSAASDWGADSLANVLFLRWRTTRDQSVVPIVDALIDSAHTYGTCRLGSCTQWSDIPMWDAVAAAHWFEISRQPRALVKARRAFELVDRSDAYALGACPSIDYQRPGGGRSALKTLETDSNYIRAALSLFQLTNEPALLTSAQAKYAAARRYFLDPDVPLYTVYVIDDGAVCRQLPRRFFASVNGNMIEAGLQLAALTGNAAYLADALDTAHAVARDLNDPNGVFANLAADNDVAQPLVEAMYDLATQQRAAFARHWLLAGAGALTPGPTGAYGRFFDGPAPGGTVSAWSASGGLSLAVAAAALEPGRRAGNTTAWATARFVEDRITAVPAVITFEGRAIALIGTLGAVCCEAGHVRVFIDGRETFDRTGIWQNKSPAARRLPGSILFSWRWPRAGRHTLAFAAPDTNAKEGGSFLQLAGYELVP